MRWIQTIIVSAGTLPQAACAVNSRMTS
jgi:hypothetical protein